MNNGYEKVNGKNTAIIIGSGVAGLAAGIRLQATGQYNVTILEKLDQIGGRARVFKDKGFTFDAGPTVITVPEIFEDLFTLVNRKMKDYVDIINGKLINLLNITFHKIFNVNYIYNN